MLGWLYGLAWVAGHINKALKSSDIVAICHAIGEATRLHHVSDIGFSRKTPLGGVMSHQGSKTDLKPRMFMTALPFNGGHIVTSALCRYLYD